VDAAPRKRIRWQIDMRAAPLRIIAGSIQPAWGFSFYI